ncbi:28S ribosomal protein S18b, mitochondrial [Chionoecetes opilio]|uniref:Small ribosomal subunit protein mS40 n=1 Tax=Chionoecetes opilio TaxID=41210 RepID=A0A8J4YJ93_CHIOP|nr:28S ribosomal protein S18b, mitochondrial [Chionoecetes opilio]
MSVSSLVAGVLRAATGLHTGRTGARSILQGWHRGVALSAAVRCEENDDEDNVKVKAEVDPAKDRSQVIPVETSLKYMQSQAYQTTYGDDPVWKKYRRNFKGAFAPRETRKTCIRSGVISTGNPCPACRDEYLVLDPVNVTLLRQFISPHNNAILPTSTTNLCRKKQQALTVAVRQARDLGLLTFDIPFRHYHYPDYYPTVDSTSSTTPVSHSTELPPPSSQTRDSTGHSDSQGHCGLAAVTLEDSEGCHSDSQGHCGLAAVTLEDSEGCHSDSQGHCGLAAVTLEDSEGCRSDSRGR